MIIITNITATHGLEKQESAGSNFLLQWRRTETFFINLKLSCLVIYETKKYSASDENRIISKTLRYPTKTFQYLSNILLGIVIKCSANIRKIKLPNIKVQ